MFSDPALKQLCATLPAIALQDRAPSTVRTYLRAFCRWSQWAKSHQLSPLPARGAHVALYVAYLMQTARSASPINVAVAAIAWAHEKAGAKDPTSSLLAQQIISGTRRILAAPTKKKQPLSPEEIRSIISNLITPDTNLATLQTVTLIVLGFCSFLRWDELHRLSRRCLQFFPTHMSLFIDGRKNDTLREGHWVFVSRTKSTSCPVALLERFLREGRHTEDQPLFCKIGHRGTSQFLRSAAMTYSRARELVLQCLEGIGLDSRNYGLHSLRSGGASAAANAGVPDRLFKRHGGWRSEAAKDGYLKESLSDLLQVSRSIGL